MRLWHYKLIKYLPDTQLLAQWRELNSIFKKQDKHILINYIYDYNKENLLDYSFEVINEMHRRNFKIKSWTNFENYFEDELNPYIDHEFPLKTFSKHHDNRYLLQCFYNLQEKYDRGQKDFSEEQYLKLRDFVMSQIS